MWKVAIAHFVLTLFIVWKLVHHLAWSGPIEREVWFNAWGLFWLKVFVLFQPVLSLLVWVFHLANVSTWGGIGSFLGGLAMMISVPLWSICVGWLVVKFDNWLNHFPVLGKRVF